MPPRRHDGGVNLDPLARRQRGVISRAQARQVLSDSAIRHRLASGRWRVVHRGVYVTHTADLDWYGRAVAALILAGPGAALGLASAAYVQGLERRPPPVIVVVVPHGRQVAKVPGVRVHRRRDLATTVVKGLRCTVAAQTVLDLAAQPGVTASDAVALAADAVRIGVCRVPQLAAALRHTRAHPNRRPLKLALGDIDAGVQSLLEHRALNRVLRAHRLPTMQLQVPGPGVRRDFVNIEFGVILEVDGTVGHLGSDRLADYRRDRRAARSGLITLRAGWVDVDSDPCALAVDLAGALAARGWRGRARLCGPHCGAIRRVGA